MATITYNRKKMRFHPDGTIDVELIEEVHHWPMLTCLGFREQFPDNVVSIDDTPVQAVSERNSERRSRSTGTRSAPKTHKIKTSKPSVTTQDFINEEAKKYAQS